jgi:hypothetical protein
MFLGLLSGFMSMPTLFLFIIPMFIMAYFDGGLEMVHTFIVLPGLACLGAFIACLLGNPFTPEFTFFGNVFPWMIGVPGVYAFIYSKL